MTDNVLYLNQGDFKFKDISKVSGVKGKKSWTTGVTMADINADGWLDIYVCYSGNGNLDSRRNELYINQGDLTFKEEAAAYGLDDPSNSTQSLFFDFDKDGDIDLFVGGRSLPNRYPEADQSYLLKNESKGNNVKFVSVQAESLASLGMVTSSVWHDINQDGWIDLIVAGELMPITILENQKGKLVDKTEAYHLAKSHGRWSKILW